MAMAETCEFHKKCARVLGVEQIHTAKPCDSRVVFLLQKACSKVRSRPCLCRM